MIQPALDDVNTVLLYAMKRSRAEAADSRRLSFKSARNRCEVDVQLISDAMRMASGCALIREPRQPDAFVSRLIDAETEFVDRVNVANQLIAALQKRRPLDLALLDFRQQ
jgi:hypothetical protein